MHPDPSNTAAILQLAHSQAMLAQSQADLAQSISWAEVSLVVFLTVLFAAWAWVQTSIMKSRSNLAIQERTSAPQPFSSR
jgi:hypothetical protein